MKVKIAAAAAAFMIVIGGLFVRQAWIDTHPPYSTEAHSLKAGYSIEVPAGWPKPDEETEFVVVENAPDLREGSLDRFGWHITIHDHGLNGTIDEVLGEVSSGCLSPSRVKNVVLANGTAAKTMTCWMYLGELNQEHRGYVFKAPNGRVYSGWQPMARDWRTKRRYDNYFRAVLGSMKFKP